LVHRQCGLLPARRVGVAADVARGNVDIVGRVVDAGLEAGLEPADDRAVDAADEPNGRRVGIGRSRARGELRLGQASGEHAHQERALLLTEQVVRDVRLVDHGVDDHEVLIGVLGCSLGERVPWLNPIQETRSYELAYSCWNCPNSPAPSGSDSSYSIPNSSSA